MINQSNLYPGYWIYTKNNISKVVKIIEMNVGDFILYGVIFEEGTFPVRLNNISNEVVLEPLKIGMIIRD